ncbi:unnamed protein product [marine sediment metagenome]|uniref:Uncharacterized protein n=1 Tax=marine sediment metagenome TaxID=412755 RepID=X1RAN9_9ZZZZ
MKRPNIDYRKLAAYKGQTLLAKEILEICGYSPNTGINDTFLAQNKIITPILGTYPTQWFVSQDWGFYGL